MTYFSGDTKTVIGRMSGRELAQLRETHGDELFDKNVRKYIVRKNDVNINIKSTARGDDSAYFFYLNNGLTITCDRLSYFPKDESPDIELNNFQIVNGGQTTNSIFDTYKLGRLKEDVYVLVRLIESSNKELTDKITKSTNSQTLVSARDLRSNDPIQSKIKSYLETRGYYYEAKKDECINQPRTKRIDAAKAAQSYYSFVLQQPADAKNKKRLLFGSLYQDIFNDSIDMELLLQSYLLHSKVHNISKKTSDYDFIRDSELHTLALLKEFICNKEAGTTVSNEEFTGMYDKIIKATNHVVLEAQKISGSKYSHRALFINTSTLGRIQEKLSEKTNSG